MKIQTVQIDTGSCGEGKEKKGDGNDGYRTT